MVHVLDASRGVPVAQTLLDKTRNTGFMEDVREVIVGQPKHASVALLQFNCLEMELLVTHFPDVTRQLYLKGQWISGHSNLLAAQEYAEMREEFLAGLEDRSYLTLAQARGKGLQVNISFYVAALVAAVTHS